MITFQFILLSSKDLEVWHKDYGRQRTKWTTFTESSRKFSPIRKYFVQLKQCARLAVHLSRPNIAQRIKVQLCQFQTLFLPAATMTNVLGPIFRQTSTTKFKLQCVKKWRAKDSVVKLVGKIAADLQLFGFQTGHLFPDREHLVVNYEKTCTTSVNPKRKILTTMASKVLWLVIACGTIRVNSRLGFLNRSTE